MNGTLKGFLFVIGSIFIASAQSVFLSHWLSGIDIYLVIFLSFSIVFVLYITLSAVLSRHRFNQLGTMKNDVLLLNLVSAGNWIFYFFAIKYLDPAAVVSITQCLPPVIVTAFMLLTKRNVIRSTVLFHAGILATIVALVTTILATPQAAYPNPLLGGIAALLCAITVSATIGISKRFSTLGIPSYMVLSVRFPLLISISFIMLPQGALNSLTLTNLAVIAGIALIGLSLSNLLLQKGIERTTPTIVSTTLAVSPFVVLVFDKASRNDLTITPQALLIVVIVLLSLACIYVNSRSTACNFRAEKPTPSTIKNT